MILDEYLTGFYFNVRFNGISVPFKEVSGISKEMNFEEVVGGGENRFKYRLPTIATSQNLVLKKAITAMDSPLVIWISTVLNGGHVIPIHTVALTVELLNSKGLPTMVWVFHNAYPIKYSVSEFNSQENQLAIESIEVAYNYFDVL